MVETTATVTESITGCAFRSLVGLSRQVRDTFELSGFSEPFDLMAPLASLCSMCVRDGRECEPRAPDCGGAEI